MAERISNICGCLGNSASRSTDYGKEEQIWRRDNLVTKNSRKCWKEGWKEVYLCKNTSLSLNFSFCFFLTISSLSEGEMWWDALYNQMIFLFCFFW